MRQGIPMKHAIVTGGGGGIGSAICEALGAAGYRVGVFDYDLEAAHRTAQRIEGAVGIKVDITDETSVAQAFTQFGGLADVLVNNAGITAKGGLQQDATTFRRIIDVNLVGAYIMTQVVVPQMLVRRAGAIVNVTSIAASTANPASGGYGPAKAALTNLTKAMALEYGPQGVRVNAVAPGMINAGLGSQPSADPAILAQRLAMVPVGFLGSAKNIADVVLFLASDGAHYVHGQEIIVDGALTLAMLASVGRQAPSKTAG
jgi:NAD(P)-dependent dehydrogenase (short-subunit alcohol dehydrogenase family)